MNRSFTFKQGCSAIMAGVCSIVFAAAFAVSAQVTSVKLPKADSSASFRVLDSGSVVKMRLNGDGGFYTAGTYGKGVIPATGTGARMMWYPAKAAFREGNGGAQWDDANIGVFSIAMGNYPTASGIGSVAIGNNITSSGRSSTAMGESTTAIGDYSTAWGNFTTATGTGSTAMGLGSRAIGDYSTAMGTNDTASGYASMATGYNTTASGTYSVAMGFITRASGSSSMAMGYGTLASGESSTAMGHGSTASGTYSTAMGMNATASGNYSTAMGNYVSTNSFAGSFVIGDNSTATTNVSTAVNQMMMRFAGGYRLFTDAAATMGVSLAAGASSWGTISDSTKKTNFKKADHDYFLSSLSKLKLGSWNYKSQDAKNFRHYGPMAQEIYNFFGHDGKGTIGCDTLLASADMDGIMMICLQALEKRTGELQKANDKIAVMEKQNIDR
jgi:hypothetical protein